MYKETKQWVNWSKFGLYIIIENVWFDTKIISADQIFTILLRHAIFLYSQWRSSSKMAAILKFRWLTSFVKGAISKLCLPILMLLSTNKRLLQLSAQRPLVSGTTTFLLYHRILEFCLQNAHESYGRRCVISLYLAIINIVAGSELFPIYCFTLGGWTDSRECAYDRSIGSWAKCHESISEYSPLGCLHLVLVYRYHFVLKKIMRPCLWHWQQGKHEMGESKQHAPHSKFSSTALSHCHLRKVSTGDLLQY